MSPITATTEIDRSAADVFAYATDPTRSTSRLDHINPPTTWRVKGTDGPIRATVDLTVEPLADTRSRLTIAVDLERHGIGKILVPLLARREAQKEMPGNLATLKHRLETANK